MKDMKLVVLKPKKRESAKMEELTEAQKEKVISEWKKIGIEVYDRE